MGRGRRCKRYVSVPWALCFWEKKKRVFELRKKKRLVKGICDGVKMGKVRRRKHVLSDVAR